MEEEPIYIFTDEELQREKDAAEASRELVWFSVRDLAQKLSVTERQIRRWQQKRRIPYHKVANRILFLWEEVEPKLSKIYYLIERSNKPNSVMFDGFKNPINI